MLRIGKAFLNAKSAKNDKHENGVAATAFPAFGCITMAPTTLRFSFSLFALFAFKKESYAKTWL